MFLQALEIEYHEEIETEIDNSIYIQHTNGSIQKILSPQQINACNDITDLLPLLISSLYSEIQHDEIYDVYNKAGEITSMATWKTVHNRGLLHHTTAILLFKDESEQEILLQQRSKSFLISL